MRKQVIVALLLIVALGTALGFRLRAQRQAQHAPSGGSTTVEGTEYVAASRTSGRIKDLLVDEGELVHRGQVLGHLDCADNEAQLVALDARIKSAQAQVVIAHAGMRVAKTSVGAAHAQVLAARAQIEAMQSDLQQTSRDEERASTLERVGAFAGAESERLGARHNGLKHQVASAEANELSLRIRSASAADTVQVESARVAAAEAAVAATAAERRRLELAIDECKLIAPEDGVITARHHEPGAVVAPGVRVFTLLDLRKAKLTFYLPNAELARARLGAPAELRVDAYPGRVFQGAVRKIASEAEFTPRNVQTREDRDRLVYAVEIVVDNADGALRAGMPGDVLLVGTGR